MILVVVLLLLVVVAVVDDDDEEDDDSDMMLICTTVPPAHSSSSLRLQAEYGRLHLALETSVAKTGALDLQDSAATMTVVLVKGIL